MAGRSRLKRHNSTLTERAYFVIKNAILTGEIREGAFLSEAEIRQQFNISRTPLREACNRLHNEQLLDSVAHRGYFVPEMSFRQVRDIFETRLILEASIAELAAIRSESSQVSELEAIQSKLLSRAELAEEYRETVRGNTEFHLCLARMAQNLALFELAKKTLEHMERLSYLEYRRAGFKKGLTMVLHDPIVKAIQKKDPDGARRAVINDIASAQTIITGMLSPASATEILDHKGKGTRPVR